jgi:hypothetical protein
MDDFELLEKIINECNRVPQNNESSHKVERTAFSQSTNVRTCCDDEDYIEEDVWVICKYCGYSINNASIEISSKKESMLYYRKDLEYSRIKYWNEYVSYLEGNNKKYYDIPKNIVEIILTNLKIIYTEITYESIYKIMKKNKINGYTKHIPYFCKTYLNIEFPKFNLNEKAIFVSQFELLLKKFVKKDYGASSMRPHDSSNAKHSHARQNFFSFGYLINKFRLNDRQLQFFNVSEKSVIQQDKIYDAIR